MYGPKASEHTCLLLQATGAKRRAVFAKPGGQCSGVSPWDTPLALQSCRLSSLYVLRDRENVLLAETRPEKQQPRPPLGLAQSDCYLLGVDKDDERCFQRMVCRSHLDRDSLLFEKVFNAKSV